MKHVNNTETTSKLYYIITDDTIFVNCAGRSTLTFSFNKKIILSSYDQNLVKVIINLDFCITNISD